MIFVKRVLRSDSDLSVNVGFSGSCKKGKMGLNIFVKMTKVVDG
jgi:hypothetical protein